MAPPNLQGLNIVHQQHNNDDAQDLLSGSSYPDLSAQLDLWTNLAFESDEGALGEKYGQLDDDKYDKKHGRAEEEEDEQDSGKAAIHDGHVNVVTGRNVGTNIPSNHPQQQPQQQTPSFDLNAFLAGFGIDPFSAPPAQVETPGTTNAPSLAQLLAIHSAQVNGYVPSAHATSSQQQHHHSFSLDDDSYPANKRSRTRKSSVSSSLDHEYNDRDTSPNLNDLPLTNPNGTPLSAAEDKRRRNTAASARFRLKKKEREAALESKAKELEGRVGELERECEGLRRENGWLKGLVVGVTGAAQGQQQATVNAVVGAGVKRSRDELSA